MLFALVHRVYSFWHCIKSLRSLCEPTSIGQLSVDLCLCVHIKQVFNYLLLVLVWFDRLFVRAIGSLFRCYFESHCVTEYANCTCMSCKYIVNTIPNSQSTLHTNPSEYTQSHWMCASLLRSSNSISSVHIIFIFIVFAAAAAALLPRSLSLSLVFVLLSLFSLIQCVSNRTQKQNYATNCFNVFSCFNTVLSHSRICLIIRCCCFAHFFVFLRFFLIAFFTIIIIK